MHEISQSTFVGKWTIIITDPVAARAFLLKTGNNTKDRTLQNREVLVLNNVFYRKLSQESEYPQHVGGFAPAGQVCGPVKYRLLKR